MKKQLALIFALMLTLGSFAQVVSKGDHYATAFLGIGGTAYDSYNYGLLVPPVGAQYEVILTDEIGIGHIGVSGTASYSARRYTGTFFDSMYHYLTIGARGMYHFNLGDYLDEPFFNDLDAYAGLFMGMNYRLETTTDTYYTHAGNRLLPVADLIIGGRYYLSDNFAAMAELGFGVTFLSVGVTMKLSK